MEKEEVEFLQRVMKEPHFVGYGIVDSAREMNTTSIELARSIIPDEEASSGIVASLGQGMDQLIGLGNHEFLKLWAKYTGCEIPSYEELKLLMIELIDRKLLHKVSLPGRSEYILGEWSLDGRGYETTLASSTPAYGGHKILLVEASGDEILALHANTYNFYSTFLIMRKD